ncbi:MAG: hypothetical protein M9894_04855 [Planctomycetes bacterium]|nr:hypothetical protein [Planctomycetota bacterium]
MKTPALLVALLLLLPPVTLAQDEAPPAWGEARKVCDLEDRQIKESSGLAASRRHAGVFWTHNDSGDSARLFAIDAEGRTRATLAVEGAEAVDWEDIAAFTWRERAWLLVADTGDNGRVREHVVLYLVEEPADLPATGSLRVAARVEVRYEDGAHDCESVAVDETSGTVLLVTKQRLSGRPGLYLFPLPEDLARPAPVLARKAVDLEVPPLTTAMDVSPDGRLAVVLTYGDAYAFPRRDGEGWEQALGRAPIVVKLPPRRQGEALCFGHDGRSLWLTSEKRPTPLFEVPRR